MRCVLMLTIQGWLSNNLAPHYVRATGIGFEIAFANCAAFIAVFVYLEQDAYASLSPYSPPLCICRKSKLTIPIQTTLHPRPLPQRGRFGPLSHHRHLADAVLPLGE